MKLNGLKEKHYFNEVTSKDTCFEAMKVLLVCVFLISKRRLFLNRHRREIAPKQELSIHLIFALLHIKEQEKKRKEPNLSVECIYHCCANWGTVNIREVKHDVYGKRQTANGKNETFAVSLQASSAVCTVE